MLSGERINLGILFSEESTGYHSFYYTKNFNRLKSFDDDLDKSVVKTLLAGIEKEISDYWNEYQSNIEEFIKFYINDYRFETTQAIVYEDLYETVNDLIRVYFRFDLEKDNRPSKNEDQKIIANLISASGAKFRKNQKTSGIYNENIIYDIITDDYYIKIFDFDGKNLKRCVNTAKVWAWNCIHESKPIYIVYRYSENDPTYSSEFSIIEEIFTDAKAHFINIDNTDVLLKKIS